jgi:hypothetical protein
MKACSAIARIVHPTHFSSPSYIVCSFWKVVFQILVGLNIILTCSSVGSPDSWPFAYIIVYHNLWNCVPVLVWFFMERMLFYTQQLESRLSMHVHCVFFQFLSKNHRNMEHIWDSSRVVDYIDFGDNHCFVNMRVLVLNIQEMCEFSQNLGIPLWKLLVEDRIFEFGKGWSLNKT